MIWALCLLALVCILMIWVLCLRAGVGVYIAGPKLYKLKIAGVLAVVAPAGWRKLCRRLIRLRRRCDSIACVQCCLVFLFLRLGFVFGILGFFACSNFWATVFWCIRLPIVGSCCVRNYFGGEQFVNDLERAPNITGMDFKISIVFISESYFSFWICLCIYFCYFGIRIFVLVTS